MTPITSYSSHHYRNEAKLRTEAWAYVRFEPVDERAKAWIATTTGDAQGRFKFKNVPPGKYYVSTIILWEVADKNTPTQGGQIWREITVDGESSVEDLIITR